jgi:hypothetical protein
MLEEECGVKIYTAKVNKIKTKTSVPNINSTQEVGNKIPTRPHI